MGGGYYEREVESTPSTSTCYSTASVTAMGSTNLHTDCNPLNRRLTCTAGTPIVCAVDVTGSMGDWPRIIYDKLPMHVLWSNHGSRAPLQVCDFAQGTTIDDWIKKIWLEKGGGSGHFESYDFAAYYYARCCDVPAEPKGFLFFTGDEGFYKEIPREKIQQLLGVTESANVETAQIFKELRRKFHVFLLHKQYSGGAETEIMDQWTSVIGGEHILQLTDPKACIDVMLGAISITSGARSLSKYLEDMTSRGQDSTRLHEVEHALRAMKL
ncbi:hypothetical protein Pelo_7671 [Pelomyxa schiedti]|nr:hypothetical protein Pelo_7671 [Pelomyxa schiedti]